MSAKRSLDPSPAATLVGSDGGTGLTSVEICAGAGGQALGLDKAGFRHLALVEYEDACCETLRAIPKWRKIVRNLDLHEWTAEAKFRNKVDLFAGGVPCPPFSRAGHRLGPDDERDLFPKALSLIEEIDPRAVMLENVRGLLSHEFAAYRADIKAELWRMGYVPDWKLLHASHFGVPQLRPRAIMVALKKDLAPHFEWPEGDPECAPTVGETLYREMASRGWPGAKAWREQARGVGPTLVGGSKKHGGPDLGPTQAKKQWLAMGVDGLGIADEPPGPEWNGAPPKLTVRMTALLQGFPKDWPFAGKKTNQYRQVGNAFPPPVAEAVGRQIAFAFVKAAEGANTEQADPAARESSLAR